MDLKNKLFKQVHEAMFSTVGQDLDRQASTVGGHGGGGEANSKAKLLLIHGLN